MQEIHADMKCRTNTGLAWLYFFMEKYIFILKSAGIAVHGISGSFSENRPSLHMGNKHQKVKAVFKIFLSSHPNPKILTPFVKAVQNGSIKNIAPLDLEALAGL